VAEAEKGIPMGATFVVRIAFIAALLGAGACAQAIVTRLPQPIRRVAVLPPYELAVNDTRIARTETAAPGLPSRTIGDVLAQHARARLVEKGFEALEPGVVKLATKDRMPSSSQMAAQIVREANLDATALYIEVRRWEPTPNSRGMKADGVIVALDVTMVDPKTGAILWEVHRPSRPVPLYGVVLTGQANVFVAETVMQEVFAQLGSRQPGTW
jgi:hypothetical protein